MKNDKWEIKMSLGYGVGDWAISILIISSGLVKKRVVRDLPKITIPQNHICKSCQMGKRTQNSFKFKDKLSSSKPL